MADVKTGTCSYCGKEIAISGLKNHERACAKKLNIEVEEADTTGCEVVDCVDNIEEVDSIDTIEVEPEDEAKEELEVITESKPKVKLVDIRIAESICCHIAGTRYNFHRGEVYQVPENVKQILWEAGLLLAM